jgi:tetratricopeptide (TPR) repeat protein
VNLLVTVDAAAKVFGATVAEKACQPLKVAGQWFNVAFFYVKEDKRAEKMFDLLNAWAHPGTPGDIEWACVRWQNIIMVICTSDAEVQQEVKARYLGNLLEVLDGKAADLLKQGQADKALACYRFLRPTLKDLPHAYQAWGGLFLYQASDYPNALACYERAAKEGGEATFTVEELWQIHEGIGLCAGLSKDPKKAEAAFLKSLEIAKKSQSKRLLGSSNYNLACAYAEQGVPAKMYQYLEEAFKCDKQYAAGAPQDSSFAKYAAEPGFKALVAQYAK